MDFVKKQLETIQQNLAGLNATQKMLTGALVAIMAMTMVYWSRYAGTAEMEPVLNQSLTDADITRMSASLDSHGVPYKVESGKLLVSADKKMQALATLSYEQLLPSNTISGFEQMMAKGSTWDSPQQREDLKNHGREITLAQVIGGFPNVQSAVVMIDPTSIRRIGEGNSVSPTSNISISMRSGAQADNKLVNAAADLVTGAVSGMNRGKIKVVVDGRPRRVNDSGADSDYGSANEQLEAIQSYERNIAAKIENQFQMINGVVASVTGTLNTESKESTSTTNDEKNTLILPSETENKTTESNNSTGGGGEPGALPNTSVSLGGGAGSGSNTMTESVDKTKNTIALAVTHTKSRKPAGDFTTVAASVRIPRSYFVGVLKNINGGKDPSESEIQEYLKEQLAEIRQSVRACTNIKKDEDIFVGTYAESMPTVAATAAAGVTGSSSSITGLIGGWGKEAGIAVLAVVSLFMVSTMVKRSTPAPLVVTKTEAAGPASLEASEAVAGFAAEGGSTLAGMELDEDAIQTQQVLDQVTNLVGENPDGAAALVKRWLNRT
jgi:flagellar biosynthesis/type III secretory pathway M-ring protein FliF/YscJ